MPPPSNPLLDPNFVPTTKTRISLLAAGGHVDVPVIATGTWSWGDSTWNYDEAKGGGLKSRPQPLLAPISLLTPPADIPADLDNVKEAFKEAQSQGGFLDTAECVPLWSLLSTRRVELAQSLPFNMLLLITFRRPVSAL
jgi:hypothetical protein